MIIYYYVVAIVLLCFLCKSYVATQAQESYVALNIGISQIYRCAHMVNFHWHGHI